MFVVANYHGDGRCGEPLAVYRRLADMREDYPNVQDYNGDGPLIIGGFVFVELEPV